MRELLFYVLLPIALDVVASYIYEWLRNRHD